MYINCNNENSSIGLFGENMQVIEKTIVENAYINILNNSNIGITVGAISGTNCGQIINCATINSLHN